MVLPSEMSLLDQPEKHFLSAGMGTLCEGRFCPLGELLTKALAQCEIIEIMRYKAQHSQNLSWCHEVFCSRHHFEP